jgi:hypothetical protein
MLRRLACATLSVGCVAGCAGALSVVPRYPYAEDRSLGLQHETLSLAVERDGAVRVTADFRFVERGARRDRLMTFPVAGPRPATQGFTAELGAPGGQRLTATRATPGVLPMGAAAETWDFPVDGAALARHGGRLVVRYVQPGAGDFGYILKSGAYWSGPIESLSVIVDDPHARVRASVIEGRRVELDARRRVVVELTNVEPESGVTLELI